MRKLSVRFLCIALCLLLPGCGIIDYFYLPVPEDTAQELFEAANEDMHEKNYIAAVERYNKLRETYPFSPYAIEAELSLADAYFLDGEYAAAVEAYKDFESLHPRHEAVPYVLYQIGTSRLKGFISIDRATNDLQEGYEYFNRLVQTYPGSRYEEGARKGMAQIRKLMAEHELFIADVFWQMEKYGPAWRRYSYIVETFPDVKEVAAHARKKGEAAFHHYREQHAEETLRSREGHWKNWFRWL